jgi:hypothetical protein
MLMTCIEAPTAMHSERGERLPAPERTTLDDIKAAHDKSEAEHKAAHDEDKAEHDERTQADDESKKVWRR